MTQAQILKKLKARHWQSLQRVVKDAYKEGLAAGRSRAKGAGRRGRTVRDDATVEGLARLIEEHFGLGRYAFEVRIVHPGSGRRVSAGDLIRKYRQADA